MPGCHCSCRPKSDSAERLVFECSASKPWPPQEGIRWLDAIIRVPDSRAVPTVEATLNVLYRHDMERAGQVQDERERLLLRERRLSLEQGAQGFSTLRGRFSHRCVSHDDRWVAPAYHLCEHRESSSGTFGRSAQGDRDPCLAWSGTSTAGSAALDGKHRIRHAWRRPSCPDRYLGQSGAAPALLNQRRPPGRLPSIGVHCLRVARDRDTVRARAGISHDRRRTEHRP